MLRMLGFYISIYSVFSLTTFPLYLVIFFLLFICFYLILPIKYKIFVISFYLFFSSSFFAICAFFSNNLPFISNDRPFSNTLCSLSPLQSHFYNVSELFTYFLDFFFYLPEKVKTKLKTPQLMNFTVVSLINGEKFLIRSNDM